MNSSYHSKFSCTASGRKKWLYHTLSLSLLFLHVLVSFFFLNVNLKSKYSLLPLIAFPLVPFFLLIYFCISVYINSYKYIYIYILAMIPSIPCIVLCQNRIYTQYYSRSSREAICVGLT